MSAVAHVRVILEHARALVRRARLRAGLIGGGALARNAARHHLAPAAAGAAVAARAPFSPPPSIPPCGGGAGGGGGRRAEPSSHRPSLAASATTAAATAATALPLALSVVVALAACTRPTATVREAAFQREEDRPERFIPADIDERPDTFRLRNPSRVFDTDEDAQPDTMPALPYGMTLATIAAGDAVFHGKGGCFNCHGSEAQGLPARGKTLTAGLGFLPPGDWDAIDSLVMVGMKDAQTRSPISMPPRGQRSDLSADEVRDVAAYVWAISQVRGEPWPGGHRIHAVHDFRASSRSAIP